MNYKLNLFILLIFFLTINSVYSFNSSNINSSGVHFEFDVNSNSTLFLYNDNYPISFIDSIRVNNSNSATNEVTFQIDLNPSKPSNSGIQILSSLGKLSSLLCNTSLSSSNTQFCTFNFPESWKSSEPTLYFNTYNTNSSYSLATYFDFYQKDNIEYQKSGVNLNSQSDFSGSLISYNHNYPISIIDSIRVNNSNSATNEVTFQIDLNPSKPSNSGIQILSSLGKLSSLLCNTSLSSSNTQFCTFTFPESWKSSEPTLYFNTYNANSSYSLATYFDFYQKDNIEYQKSGVSLQCNILYQTLNVNYITYPNITINKKSAFINVSANKNISSCRLNWNGSWIDSMTIDGKNCWITQNGDYNNTYTYYVEVNGTDSTFGSTVNISANTQTKNTTMIYVEPDFLYIYPTPNQNSNWGYDSFTIRINDTLSQASYINVTINNKNYSLINIGNNIWEFSTDEFKQATNITFQAYSDTGILEKRTTTFYPRIISSLPTYSPMSLVLLVIFLIIFLFISINKTKSKKAITPIITTILLLMVVVTTMVLFSGWYSSFVNNIEFKSSNQLSLSPSSVDIKGIWENNEIYTLYLKTKKKGGYQIVNSVILNDQECILTKSNLLFGSGVSPIQIVCPNYNLNSISKVIIKTNYLIKESNIVIK